jgi:ubiquinone/menaquinone biosynthesis C-methylase UbiE
MSSGSTIPPNLRPDAFVGAAADYVRYRLPYPKPLLQSFLEQAALPASDAKLIDLGCGPGRVALAIAERFGEILAVDLEPEMVEAGRREAVRLGVDHIRWSIARAEDFEVPAGRFDLITIGEAFHRLDRPRVADKAFGWLKPGGALVTLGMQNFLYGDAPWRHIVRELVTRFVGTPAARIGGSPNPTIAEAIADQESALRDAGFVEVAGRDFVFSHVWDLPDLLGNLRSMSVLSLHALGARHTAFEAELSAALLAFNPAGRFAEQISCGYTFARKPG